MKDRNIKNLRDVITTGMPIEASKCLCYRYVFLSTSSGSYGIINPRRIEHGCLNAHWGVPIYSRYRCFF